MVLVLEKLDLLWQLSIRDQVLVSSDFVSKNLKVWRHNGVHKFDLEGVEEREHVAIKS